jgi:hypothetical protein
VSQKSVRRKSAQAAGRRKTTSLAGAESPLKLTRSISARVTLRLYVQAGGRCEFDNCNKYLLEHGPTARPGNFAEQAHIYAFNERGPRGGGERPKDINALSNLMLLCKDCHHLVDSRAQDYPVAVLRKFKEEHEARIFQLTGLSKDRDTVPLVLRGLIAGRPMDISDDEMQAAVAPNYVRPREKVEIDLSSLPDKQAAAFWGSACAAIDQKLDELQRIVPRPDRTLRVSVFALAPIPLLIYLGSKLTDKQVVDLYQRHRNPETWKWAEGGGTVTFRMRRVQSGAVGDPVALLANVSGQNAAAEVTKCVGNGTVYELTVDGEAPSPLVLKTRADLERFVAEYVRAMAVIRADHPQLRELHLFPAVPAPVAVALGRSRLPKVDPTLKIYDRDDRAGGFVPALEVR